MTSQQLWKCRKFPFNTTSRTHTVACYHALRANSTTQLFKWQATLSFSNRPMHIPFVLYPTCQRPGLHSACMGVYGCWMQIYDEHGSKWEKHLFNGEAMTLLLPYIRWKCIVTLFLSSMIHFSLFRDFLTVSFRSSLWFFCRSPSPLSCLQLQHVCSFLCLIFF